MKVYMALNEAGTRGDIALHTKLAVLSLNRHASLLPFLLYMGDRNDFTRWLEDHGVSIIDTQPPYMNFITALAEEHLYSTDFVGHWLRTNVCLTEQEDEYVFYTDVDVLYLKPPVLDTIRPRHFAAAPEFDMNCWDYFNAGVMVQNVRSLRDEYRRFERYLIANLCGRTYGFHDQIAYNEFYHGRWDKLPLELNWKPYWGVNKDATLLHFHGTKIGPMGAIVNDVWNWTNKNARQLGSLFVNSFDSYLESFEQIKSYLPDLEAREQDELNELFEKAKKFDRHKYDAEIDLRFTKGRMFSRGYEKIQKSTT